MQIILHDKPVTIDREMSVAEFVERVEVPPNYLAIEINDEVVPREDYESVIVRADDRVEVVTLVGGG